MEHEVVPHPIGREKVGGLRCAAVDEPFHAFEQRQRVVGGAKRVHLGIDHGAAQAGAHIVGKARPQQQHAAVVPKRRHRHL